MKTEALRYEAEVAKAYDEALQHEAEVAKAASAAAATAAPTVAAKAAVLVKAVATAVSGKLSAPWARAPPPEATSSEPQPQGARNTSKV